MANNPTPTPGGTAGDSPSSLTERVRTRVAEVGRSLPRSSGALRRRSKASPTNATPHPAVSDPNARSLARVFHELGDAHREYRQRTGQRVPPELREAADAFKRDRSLTSLVAVAGHLDELGILAW
ncbi:MAG TPA: hypothetical protein VH763_00180 [Gemmatimonadales bacterium]|jgi:hypothetical protein